MPRVLPDQRPWHPPKSGPRQSLKRLYAEQPDEFAAQAEAQKARQAAFWAQEEAARQAAGLAPFPSHRRRVRDRPKAAKQPATTAQDVATPPPRRSSPPRPSGPRWDSGKRSGGPRVAKTPSRSPAATAEDFAPLDPLAVWRSHLTQQQIRAGFGDGIDPDCLRLHQRLFGWRHDRPKDWSWPT